MGTIQADTNAIAVSHPLRSSQFQMLWVGHIISLLGDQLFLVGVPWLILQIGSTLALGTIMMTMAIPRSIFVLVGGVVTDRMSARRILMAAAILRAAAVATLAALVMHGAIHIWHLYGIAVVFGVADAFAQPAEQSLLPSILHPEQLPAGNALMSGSALVCYLVGVAPAGIIIKTWGVGAAFAIDAVSFLLVIAALWRVRTISSPAVDEATQGAWRQLVEGIEYVSRDASLRSLILLAGALNFGIVGPLTIGLSVLAKTRFGSSSAYSSMLVAVAVGTLAGVAVAGLAKFKHYLGIGLLIFCCMLGSMMIVIGYSYRLPVILGLLLILGLGNGLVMVFLQSWFQTRTESRLLGRTMSVFVFVGSGLLPLSYAVAGALAQVNLQVMFASAGILTLSLTFLASWNKSIRSLA